MEPNFNDSLPTVWQSEFTVENVIDYARASRDLSDYIRVLNEEGFNNLVVPSRGALPFIEAATKAYMLKSNSLETYEERFAGKVGLINSPFMRQLILPFSADPSEGVQTSGAIREYWSRVLAAIVRRNGRDPYLTFYKVVVEKLAKRSWFGALDRDLPTEKFIFVDTVISGRAICEIFKAFEKIELNQCHFILIEDSNGESIKPEYKRSIDELVNANRCTLIKVKRMFTEDRGPGASGVWSTVYPQILDAVQREFSWGKQCYGAGTFYQKVSSSQVEHSDGVGSADYNMPVTQMYSSINSAIYAALLDMHRYDQVEELIEKSLTKKSPYFHEVVASHRLRIIENMNYMLNFYLEDMRSTLEKFGNHTPLDKKVTKLLAEPRVKADHSSAEIEVSSSHLVRVIFPDADVAAFIRDAKYELDENCDVLADEWFR
ncbi:hypothetical protein [Janthinobacterium sp. GMG1]|uniref:hypothetical protein n=1 Tax=Janthinobacterium sp. GMG1 TaxID=3096007 RepID=UPI002ACAE1E0|nr:hypothetical protein [Janthinobacterium sp. GMG1]MDZ5633497.1 hypothetical protein [Janthinobacterium sp. GMG1]